MAELNREFLVNKYGKDNLININSIDLSKKEIGKIDSDTFKGLENVERLYLYNNEIEEIDVKLFKSLPNLKELYLYNNKLKTIDSNVFEQLTRLKKLSLVNNKIEKIKVKSFENFLNLQFLYLDNNKIEEIEVKSFESLSNLREVYLGYNKLKRIDFNTFKQLNRLKKLSLKHNEIENIDANSFESLSQLEVLYLDNNRLKRIDSNTFKGLTKLETLWLDYNQIEEIEVRSFESLSSLKELYLSFNILKRIGSNTFIGLKKLVALQINNNRIDKIDVKSCESLSNLEWLSLSYNKLKTIDSNAFKQLTGLKTLSLSENEIEDIDVESFENLSNLRELYLDNNKLKRIYSSTFKGLSNLEKLHLDNNKIENIDRNAFERLSNLKELLLYINKLKEINRKCFEPLKSIEAIQLYENDGLKALSFMNTQNELIVWYNKGKVKEYGSVSDWNKFLLQFPDLEKQREQEAVNKRAKEERDNGEKPSFSLSSSYNQTTNKKRDKLVQDQYIGKFLNDRYEVVRKLGKGSFGLVYLVEDTKIESENRKIRQKAMKVMNKFDKATENELELFFEIVHENIVRYFDHFHLKIEEEYLTFLITEYCENGDLKNKIEETKQQDKNFDENQIMNWIIQATNALKYLHSKKPNPIIHRDIKPANMLLNGRNEIKLADLGLSKQMVDSHLSSHTGSRCYMSPEVSDALFKKISYYPNTDVWSLGCVLYELKFLAKAFPKGQFENPPVPSNASSSGLFSSILPRMLEKNCLVRISSRRLLTELENMYDDNNDIK